MGRNLILSLCCSPCWLAAPRRRRSTLPARRKSFPADALITQRGVLTVLGRQFTLNGYLASSATGGKRLIVTENFGSVLADVLVKPDGSVQVMRSSRAFKPEVDSPLHRRRSAMYLRECAARGLSGPNADPHAFPDRTALVQTGFANRRNQTRPAAGGDV